MSQRSRKWSGARPILTGMGKIIYNTATSLDGFIADDQNSLAWLFAVEDEGGDDNAEFIAGLSVLLEGSSTYEWVLAEENLLAEPEKWQKWYDDRPTFVFTSRELPVPAGADVRFLNGPVADVLPQIREAAGDKNLWLFGGGELVGQFCDIGALDEIIVSIAPVTLGAGAPLLPRFLDSSRLRLTDVRRFGQFAKLFYSVTN
jgi:dihydrofolate reductase